MPVVVVPYDSVLQLRLVTGTDPDSGNSIIKTKSFNKVKESATEQDVFDVANQLASLQNYSLDEIRLNQSAQLTS
ncbi:MAG: DUF1659 domain-containing protein [Candidatus Caldatribacteriota bacterium]|jgi:hypothetical protein|nr:DUF1659 domain-containing protein [Atribacterota bacterium]MDD3641647.1 DUF1659 domain-containing protein [Atribacterota bacterium]MDD4289590.1 DUF1659 domain-containing protein [Atribacterota bacterium]MDD4765228.1 DUF1659 domain-containing protein [Atribacterota bacterium]MDD5635686.1 DUF1659 domain-containing protein [Atribacterota bacterium]